MDWQPILDKVQETLAILVGLLLAWLIARVKNWVDAHTQQAQEVMATWRVRELVQAAEQLFGDGTGKAKLDYVVDAAQRLGFDVTREQIEAAVYEQTAKKGSGD